jgi:hypothetical protein
MVFGPEQVRVECPACGTRWQESVDVDLGMVSDEELAGMPTVCPSCGERLSLGKSMVPYPPSEWISEQPFD